MRWTHAIRARLNLLFRRRSEQRMEEEMLFHLEMETERYLREGWSPEEARRHARVAFGGLEGHKEKMRQTRTLAWASGLSLDLKLGLRMLRKSPGLTLVGGLGMAVATGIGAGVFAFSSAVGDPSLPLAEGDRIVAIETWDAARREWERRVLHDFARWREEMTSVSDLAAFRVVSRNMILGNAVPEPVRIAEMTGSGFRIARVPPLLGRYFAEADEAGASPVLVIGYDEWQSRFSGDDAIVGREVRLGNEVYTVVGVMPEGFAFPVNHGFWIPLRAESVGYEPRQGPEVIVFGRLSPGVTREEAGAELATLGRRAAADSPSTHEHLRPRLEEYAYSALQAQGLTGWIVRIWQILGSLLLVVVAANVAILVYARTAMRHGEIGVRTALGASRRRVVIQFFLEALVLAGCAALVGALGARVVVGYALAFMERELDGRPFWIDSSLSASTVLYVVGITVLGAFIAGVLPALRATGPKLQKTLRALGGGTGLHLGKTWTTLVVAQVTVAVCGLPVAYVIALESLALGATAPTFATEDLLIAEIALDETTMSGAGPDPVDPLLASRYPDRFLELTRRLEAEPGISGVTYSASRPGRSAPILAEVEDAPLPTGPRPGHIVSRNHVDPALFQVLGVPPPWLGEGCGPTI